MIDECEEFKETVNQSTGPHHTKFLTLPDVEVQYFLADAEFLAKRDRRRVDVAGLHEYRRSASVGCNPAQPHQRCQAREEIRSTAIRAPPQP